MLRYDVKFPDLARYRTPDVDSVSCCDLARYRSPDVDSASCCDTAITVDTDTTMNMATSTITSTSLTTTMAVSTDSATSLCTEVLVVASSFGSPLMCWDGDCVVVVSADDNRGDHTLIVTVTQERFPRMNEALDELVCFEYICKISTRVSDFRTSYTDESLEFTIMSFVLDASPTVEIPCSTLYIGGREVDVRNTFHLLLSPKVRRKNTGSTGGIHFQRGGVDFFVFFLHALTA